MGLKLFVKDGMFYPTEHGLVVGDVVDLVLVAGGNGSNGSGVRGGTPGADSFFGIYYTAKAGLGAPGGATPYQNPRYGGIGGGGGFVPGAPYQGGPGLPAPLVNGTWIYPVNTNAGGASYGQTVSSTVETSGVFSGNGASFGGGNSGAWGGNCGLGGAGYGAGGGMFGASSANAYFSGNAGQIVYASHIITEDDVSNGIPITVGNGGSGLEGQIRTISAAGSVYGVKAVKDIIPGLSYGPNGVHKTFECWDGTYGLTPASGSTPGPLGQVKFMGIDAFRNFSDCFPGFTNGLGAPVFRCGDYYIQLVNGSSGCQVRWVLASAARAGQVAADQKGTWTVGTGYTPVGVNKTDLVAAISSTQILVYKDWSPEATSGTPVTLSAAIPLTTNTDTYLLPVGAQFYPVQSSQNYQNASTYKIIQDYNTGATTDKSYSPYAVQPCSIYGRVHSYFYSSGWSFGTRHIESGNAYNASTTIDFYLGGSTLINFPAKASYQYGLNIAPTVDDSVGVVGARDYVSYPVTADYVSFGYNNIPGYSSLSSTTGGAGGCCMITW